MNLVIDSGNTQTKVALFDKGEMQAIYRQKSVDKEFLDSVIIGHIIDRAIVSSVSSYTGLITGHLDSVGIPNTLASNTLNLPFTIEYETPHTLGVDRIAAVAGATALYPGENILVIDSGTAITYEIVTSKGNYLGGNIAPGMQMRFQALNHYTSQLPLCMSRDYKGWMGSDTTSAIGAGVVQGMINEIDGYVELMERNFDNFKVIITGGDADFFAKKLKNPIFVHQNLVMNGLNRILEYNA